MSIFEEFVNLYSDFCNCQGVYLAAHERAKDVVSAAGDRIEAERVQTAARVAELERQQNDLSRSETTRRMAALELAQLQARTYAVTGDERAAFAEAVNDAEIAVEDMRKLKVKIRQAINGLNETVNQMRADSLGFDVDLSDRWIEGTRQSFDRLGHTVQ